MVKQNKKSKIMKALSGFGYVSEGSLMIGKNLLEEHLFGIYKNLEDIKIKRGKNKSVQRVKGFGSDHYEKTKGTYNILIGNRENLLFMVYCGEESIEIIDSSSFGTKGYIYLDKRIFQILEKGEQIGFLEKILKLKRYPSLEVEESLSRDYLLRDMYLIGTNYKINKSIFSLSIESSFSDQYGHYRKLESFTSKDNFQIDLDDKKDILKAGKEIQKQLELVRSLYKF